MTERSQAADAALAGVQADGAAVSTSSPPPAALPPPPTLPPAPVTLPPLPNHGAPQPVSGAPRPAPLDEADEASADEGSVAHEVWQSLPSWLTSVVVHLSLVLLLALVTTVHAFRNSTSSTMVSAEGDGSGGEELSSDVMQMSDNLEQLSAVSPGLSEMPAPAAMSDLIGPISAQLSTGDLGSKPAGGGTGSVDALGVGGTGEGNSLELRLSGASRAAMLHSGGGTSESERAVTMSLKWLSEHQNYDGSWSFEHQKSPKCHGACRDPGSTQSKIAATSLALLPFLGNGQTHREGEYRRTVDQGLKFLLRSMQTQGDVGSLWEPVGTMYGHGLASIVLCEAYGMTRDQVLQAPAQAAINYIVYAQDPLGGGWRYEPQRPGDTSVVGWQMMALKSAKMAYLRVPPATWKKAGYFLDSVQAERGAVYGYQNPDARRPATTAIGLLCRMYLGWGHDQQALQHGVQILSQLGPSIDKTSMKNNMYYNYYATQVMHHYGGYPWQRWNAVMRDYLIHTQATRGHETGSWFLAGADHGASIGGRLYCTAMAAMTLEVYYRYMPLYRDQSTRE